MKNLKFISLSLLSLLLPGIASCASTPEITSLSLTGKNKLEVGETNQFVCEIKSTQGGEKVISWSSSNPSVAYVDKTGKVTGVKSGKATITARCGNKSAQVENVLVDGYIEHHVENVTLTVQDSKDTITDGGYLSLIANIFPENASDKTITWSSSDPALISVSKYGVIKAECDPNVLGRNKATITVTTNDGHKVATKEFTVVPRTSGEKKDIKSFRVPKSLDNYRAKTKAMQSKIDNRIINRNNSNQYINNNFFAYDDTEKELQIYKVGTANPFKFKCAVSSGIGFNDNIDTNPYQEYALFDETGKVLDPKLYISSVYKGNEFQFNSNALNKIFSLKVWPDKNVYNGVNEDEMSAILTFKVIDGYNAYDLAGLSTFDNWTLDLGKIVMTKDDREKEIINKGEFVDVWGEYKKAHNIPLTNFKATILHDDIVLDYDEIPDVLKMSKKEVNDYINGVKFPESKERFDDFVDIKANVHQDEWADYPTEVVRAKCFNLLYQSQKDATYLFHHYLHDANYCLDGNYFSIDCSNIKPTILFDKRILPNYQLNKMSLSSVFGSGNYQNVDTHRKITEAGELVYDSFRPSYTLSGRANEFVISINNVNVFGNCIKDGAHDESSGSQCFLITSFKFSLTNCIIHKVGTAVDARSTTTIGNINCSKIFDTFLCGFFLENCKVKYKNSIIKDCDGGCFRILDINNKTFEGVLIDSDNSYFESFISGNEVYNKTYIKTIFLKILGNLAYECFEKHKDVKYGKDGCFAPKVPQNYIKVENDVIYVNCVITMEIQYDDSITAEKHSHSSFTADGKNIYNIYDDYSDNGVIKQYLDPLGLPTCSMKGAYGGHAKLPLLSVVSPDDIETYYDGGGLMSSSARLSDYLANKNMYDNDYPAVAENFGKLFWGDYITFNIDVETIKNHITYCFGYK